MKKIEVYSCGVLEQVRVCLLMFKAPRKWIYREERIQGVNITLAFLVLLVFGLSSYEHILDGSLGRRIISSCVSVILQVLYTCLLVKKAKGRIQLNRIINLSLYTHIMYIAINISQDYSLISLGVYAIGHFYSILIRMMALKDWFECEYESIKLIFYIEVGIVVFVGINNWLIYIGNHMAYAQKLLHYQLLN